MKNKLFIVMLIITFFIPKISLAQEQEFDYEHILAGSCVTKDGFFFTEDGMVSLIVNTKEKIRLVGLDGQKQIDLLKVDLRACSESKVFELRIQKEMFESQLLIKQKAIDAYKSQIFWDNIKIVGGTVLGIGAGLLIGTFLIK